MTILRVKQNKIQVKDGNVVVDSPAMVNELIHNSDEVLQLLSSGGAQVKLADISIDDEGHVVIDNPNYRKAVEDVLSQKSVVAAGETNGICGIRCG